jgi:hypothetical protein
MLILQEDQDIMEADLDSADRLQPVNKELIGDELMSQQYSSQSSHTSLVKPYNNALYTSSNHHMKSKSMIDPVLHRPTTPGQLRQSIVAQTVDSLASSLAVGEMFHSQTQPFDYLKGQSTIFAASTTNSIASKKPLSHPVGSSMKTKTVPRTMQSSMSIGRTRVNQRTTGADQTKSLAPVMAFESFDAPDRVTIAGTALKGATPPMKFSYSEPPRSTSSASIRSSSSSMLESSNGHMHQSKSRKS